MANNTVMRYQIADYLGILGDTENYVLCGNGFTSLDEDVGAQSDNKTYINQRAASKDITGYETVFGFESDLMASEDAIMEVYDIGRNHKTGADAIRDYVRVEIWRPIEGKANTFAARKFMVSVEVSSVEGDGGESVSVSGNFNACGDPIDGEFNTVTRTFTPLDGTTAVLGELTVTSAVGTDSGTTAITVTPALTSGNSYKYKTGSSVIMPAHDQSCTNWSVWDGTSDITATTGDDIVIVEVDASYKAKKAGKTTVTAAE